jgi:predicted deacylase
MSLLSNHTPMSVPVHVIHGRREGPRLFVCAAVHGDEINGVEIIRRLLKLSRLSRLRGTLLAVPVVNAFGFIGLTRYLPDRRDLNRSFPGSSHGSLAAQLANLFMREVVARATHGIDLHTAAVHRINFPQVRADLSNHEVEQLAHAFGAPLVLDAAFREGSLRRAAMEEGVPTIVYEAGEALRFDEFAVRVGVNGVVRVMRALGMLTPDRGRALKAKPVLARSSYWVRAPAGGILRAPLAAGTQVEAGGRLGIVADPFGETEFPVEANDGGILIGRSNLPIVNQGDALFHIARFVDPNRAAERVELFRDELDLESEESQLDIV